MAYYLTIDKREESKVLDITNLNKFERTSNLTGTGSTIEEIDLFTSKFADEVALKTYLCENEIISPEELERKISIRMASKGKLEKVRYGLFYNYESKYLQDDYLLFKIREKINDDDFLNGLCTYYRNSYINSGTVYFIRNLLETRKRSGNVPYVEKKLPLALNEFFENEMYEIDRKTGTIKTDSNGEIKCKQRSRHDLAMFVFRYDDEIEKIIADVADEEIKEETRKRLREVKANFMTNNHTKKNIKTRVLKNEEIEGQMSLFGE